METRRRLGPRKAPREPMIISGFCGMLGMEVEREVVQIRTGVEEGSHNKGGNLWVRKRWWGEVPRVYFGTGHNLEGFTS